MDYQQPDFYKFNEDSIELAKFAAQKVVESDGKVLDLGAGSGIVGIEFLLSKTDFHLTLVEKNIKFQSYIEKNLEQFNTKAEVLISDWENVLGEYDLILSNPPYFFEDSSRPSQSLDRDHCRRWTRDQFKNFFKIIKRNLNSDGECFLSLRCERNELKDILADNNLKIEEVVEKSGCFLYQIKNH